MAGAAAEYDRQRHAARQAAQRCDTEVECVLRTLRSQAEYREWRWLKMRRDVIWGWECVAAAAVGHLALAWLVKHPG